VTDITNFINLLKEAVVDSGEDLLEHIAETFLEARKPDGKDEEQHVL